MAFNMKSDITVIWCNNLPHIEHYVPSLVAFSPVPARVDMIGFLLGSFILKLSHRVLGLL